MLCMAKEKSFDKERGNKSQKYSLSLPSYMSGKKFLYFLLIPSVRSFINFVRLYCKQRSYLTSAYVILISPLY